jgi:hypothetical protein
MYFLLFLACTRSVVQWELHQQRLTWSFGVTSLFVVKPTVIRVTTTVKPPHKLALLFRSRARVVSCLPYWGTVAAFGGSSPSLCDSVCWIPDGSASWCLSLFLKLSTGETCAVTPKTACRFATSLPVARGPNTTSYSVFRPPSHRRVPRRRGPFHHVSVSRCPESASSQVARLLPVFVLSASLQYLNQPPQPFRPQTFSTGVSNPLLHPQLPQPVSPSFLTPHPETYPAGDIVRTLRSEGLATVADAVSRRLQASETLSLGAMNELLSECGGTATNTLRVKLACHGVPAIHSVIALSRALQALGMQSILQKFSARTATAQVLSFTDVYRELSSYGATDEEVLRVGLSLDHVNRRSQSQHNL